MGRDLPVLPAPANSDLSYIGRAMGDRLLETHVAMETGAVSRSPNDVLGMSAFRSEFNSTLPVSPPPSCCRSSARRRRSGMFGHSCGFQHGDLS
jgi:hypothetical protein